MNEWMKSLKSLLNESKWVRGKIKKENKKTSKKRAENYHKLRSLSNVVVFLHSISTTYR